jgi:DNA-binding NtrC family response regulator
MVIRELEKPRLTPNPAGVTASPNEYSPPYHAPAPAEPAPPAATASPDDVDDDEPGEAAGGQDGRRLSEVAREAALAAERAVISDTLKQVHWNRRKAAVLLGVSYKTLLNKIKETGIERP